MTTRSRKITNTKELLHSAIHKRVENSWVLLLKVLPKLKSECSNRAMPLEDLLSQKGYNKIIDFINHLDSVGDLKGSPDLNAYQYNEDKTLTWLENRVRKLAKVLKLRNIHVTSGASSATFVSSNLSNTDVDEEFYLKYANGIISEYLEKELAELLEQRFNFKPELIESIGKKRKSATEMNGSNKKAKSESADNDSIGYILNTSNQNTDEVKKPKQLTAREKARQKAASGTKTISTFFTRK
ncbi:hypothetical protein ACJJTC_010281 [Scirpophaga incertulas]